MKKIISVICVCCMMFSANISAFAENEKPLEIFVSLNGDDEKGDGSYAAPFATPKRARDEIRSIKEESGLPDGGVVVNIREGTYYIKEALSLTASDSGEENKPIVYRAYLNENVHLTSAVSLDTSKFTAIKDDKVKKLLPSSAKNKVLEMDISDCKVTLGEVKYMGISGNQGTWSELILNDERAKWARYPNDEFLYTDDIVSTGASAPQEWRSYDSFVNELSGEENLFVYDWIFNGYAGALSPVKVSEDGVIGFKSVMKSHGSYEIKQGKPFYFVNSVRFIDTEGEYYIDRQNKKLYFYPPKGKYTLSLTNGKNLLTLRNTNYVSFKNITFSGSQNDGISLNTSKNITFDGCVLKNIGSSGFSILDETGDPINTEIKNGKIYDIGITGVTHLAGGNEEKLISGNFRLYNCEIYHCGVRGVYQAPAIWCHGMGKGTVGVYVGYNHIHDMNSFSANLSTEGILEHNDIERCAMLGDDTGAIYWGGRYKQRGRKINYNYIHDIKCAAKNYIHGAHGIYLDGSCGVELTNNILADIHDRLYWSSAMGLHTLRNNIFVGMDEKDGKPQTICAAAGGQDTVTREQILSEIPNYMYTEDVWIEKYPEVKKNLEREYPFVTDHKIIGNLLYNCDSMALEHSVYEGEFSDIRDNFETSKDPGFTDLKNKNYTLKENSEVFKKIKDFRNIDMTKIGTVSKNAYSKLTGGIALKVGSCLSQKGEKTVMVDENNALVTPFIENGRTLVPVRFISEAFGMTADWNEEMREVTLTGKKTVKMTLDKNEITVDGEAKTMDVSAKSVNGRTFIPLRSLSEALGKHVFWDERGLIIINDKDVFDPDYDKNEIDFLIDKTEMY